LSLLVLFLAIIALLGAAILTAVSSSLRYMRKYLSQEQVTTSTRLFFYRKFHTRFFGKKNFNTLFFSTICARHILLFVYAACAILYLILRGDPSQAFPPALNAVVPALPWILKALILLAALSISLLIGDLLPRAWSARQPEKALRIMSLWASFFLTLCFPLSFLFLKIFDALTKGASVDAMRAVSSNYSEKIFEILHEAQELGQLTANDLVLIASVIHFKDRIVREIMVPRIEVFALPHNIRIPQAAKMLNEEGYSRVPVYKDSVDNIVGILLYKDVLRLYMDNQEPIDQTVEHLVKPAFYTPETKRVSQLLQEFRNKKSHMAIVVDEYGGTEGLVTIEDILEEIVGEIADEYDVQEELLFSAQPSGGWIVDARMSILDAEENFHIHLPQGGEYDTIAGYIFDKAGTIPPKGFRIHHDSFDMEVLSSNERTVRKVRIIPRPPKGDVEEMLLE